MSQYTNTNNSKPIKFSDVDPSQITVENVTMGKDKRVHSLIRYGPYSKDLTIQCPWIKMSQYGLLPGETLKNGAKNEYYTSEDARGFIRCPLDSDNTAVTLPDGTTNSEEIKQFIESLKRIDEHLKNSTEIRKMASIDDDDIEKYNPIYRKPKTNKKAPVKDAKTKYAYIKPKLHMDYNNKEKILTRFFEVNREANETVELQPKGKFISFADIEELLVYNCDQQLIIKFVEMWSQSIGTWGVTLKILTSRVKKPARHVKQASYEFIDEGLDTVPTKQISKMVVSQPTNDSDDEPQKPIQPKSVAKVEEKAPPKKQVAQVDSDDSDASDDVKPAIKTPVKKQVAQVDSDDSDDEPTPIVKKKPVPKKDVESDDDSAPAKKTKGTKGKK